MNCPECGGEGYVEDYEDLCCGNYLPTGECCAAMYGTDYVIRNFFEQPCPQCGGTGELKPNENL